ncbi:MAG: hypothetical protein AAGH15_19030 [Myxococcota bacterium]
MSAAKKSSETPSYRIEEGHGVWPSLWKFSGLLAVIGGAISAFGFVSDPDRFGYSYLFAFFATCTLVFGGLFLTIALQMTSGKWGTTSRRFAEIVIACAPVLLVLFIPFAAGVGTHTFVNYHEWQEAEAHGAHGGHGEGHGDEHGEVGHGDEHSSLFGASVARADDGEHGGDHDDEAHAHSPQEVALHHKVLEGKTGWLNTPGWLFRGFLFIVIWIVIGGIYFRQSRKQDDMLDDLQGRIDITAKLKFWAPLAAVFFFLSLTYAAFDWLMSMEAAWYSTIFGVIIFGGSAMTIFAFVILIGVPLHKQGVVGSALNVEHFHDLGKLMFGFMCFWTYTSFSQWMLIWYAGIPEEATFFEKRWTDGWKFWSVMLPIGHFALPFFFLISRLVKRRLSMLWFGALWLVIMHCADIYWYVMPQYEGGFGLNFVDLGALLFCGGTFMTAFFLLLKRMPIIPIGDPILDRSLHHHQTH